MNSINNDFYGKYRRSDDTQSEQDIEKDDQKTIDGFRLQGLKFSTEKNKILGKVPPIVSTDTKKGIVQPPVVLTDTKKGIVEPPVLWTNIKNGILESGKKVPPELLIDTKKGMVETANKVSTLLTSVEKGTTGLMNNIKKLGNPMGNSKGNPTGKPKGKPTSKDNSVKDAIVSKLSIKKKANFVSYCLVLIVYVLFFSVFILFYNMIVTRQILQSVPPNLREFLSEFQNISGYDTYKSIIDKILFRYRIVSFFIISFFIVVFNVIIYVYVCNGNQIFYAIRVIVECILITLLPMYFFCNSPNVIKIFENSIGYAIVKNIFRVDDMSFTAFMKNFFIHRDHENVDFTFLFTMFHLNNFGDVLNKFHMNKNANFHFNSDCTESDLQNLLSAVICKNSVGHICWIFFTSIIANFLIYI